MRWDPAARSVNCRTPESWVAAIPALVARSANSAGGGPAVVFPREMPSTKTSTSAGAVTIERTADERVSARLASAVVSAAAVNVAEPGA